MSSAAVQAAVSEAAEAAEAAAAAKKEGVFSRMFSFKGKKKAAPPQPAPDEPKPAPPRQSSDGKVLVGLDFQDLPDGSVQLALGLGFPDGQDITMQRVVRAQ